MNDMTTIAKNNAILAKSNGSNTVIGKSFTYKGKTFTIDSHFSTPAILYKGNHVCDINGFTKKINPNLTNIVDCANDYLYFIGISFDTLVNNLD